MRHWFEVVDYVIFTFVVHSHFAELLLGLARIFFVKLAYAYGDVLD